MSADAMPPPTPRQREFLSMIASGLTRKQIAYECHVSFWTVKATLDQARERLGVQTLAQAGSKSIALGYITPSYDGDVAIAL